MAKISERNEGREDGGYSRVFGHPKLGALISQVQATSIAAGNELEAIIANHVNMMTHSELGQFLSGTLPKGTYVLSKPMVKKHLKAIIGSTKEPDFVVVLVPDRKVYAIELKDGDQFDTKKASGEVTLINTFAHALHGYLLSKGLDYVVEIRFCFFNQDSRDAIVSGMKGEINRSQAMTGVEFCRLIGINYKAVVAERQADATINLTYFCSRLCAMPDIRKIIEDMLEI